MKDDAPKVVKIHDVKIDKEYAHWLGEVKARFRSAQIKAAVKVNAEQLRFNWQLGQDLVVRKAEEKWGAGIVEQVSLDLQAAFPETKGFSVANLWFMKKWYLFYAGSDEKLQQLVREFQSADKQSLVKLHQVGAEIQKADTGLLPGTDFPPIFAFVPWGHHIAIISKCKSIDEALFYVINTASEDWSRQTLLNSIKADYYHTSGGAITNFSETLPSPQSNLAQAITRHGVGPPPDSFQPHFRLLFDSAEITNFTPEEKAKYQQDMTTERDIRNYITYAREEGRMEGREEGRVEGAKTQALKTAKTLLGMGYSEEVIVKSTGLTPEELRELQS